MTATDFIGEPNVQTIVMRRDFEAPRELVWKICNDPELRPQWWGPSILTTVVEKMDVRPGGEWRVIQKDPEGNEFAFRGVYLLVDPPSRTVNTFKFEGLPRHGA